jgi:hypothetical protein
MFSGNTKERNISSSTANNANKRQLLLKTQQEREHRNRLKSIEKSTLLLQRVIKNRIIYKEFQPKNFHQRISAFLLFDQRNTRELSALMLIFENIDGNLLDALFDSRVKKVQTEKITNTAEQMISTASTIEQIITSTASTAEQMISTASTGEQIITNTASTIEQMITSTAQTGYLLKRLLKIVLEQTEFNIKFISKMISLAKTNKEIQMILSPLLQSRKIIRILKDYQNLVVDLVYLGNSFFVEEFMVSDQLIETRFDSGFLQLVLSSCLRSGNLYPHNTVNPSGNLYPPNTVNPSGNLYPPNTVNPSGNLYPSNTVNSSNSLYPSNNVAVGNLNASEKINLLMNLQIVLKESNMNLHSLFFQLVSIILQSLDQIIFKEYQQEDDMEIEDYPEFELTPKHNEMLQNLYAFETLLLLEKQNLEISCRYLNILLKTFSIQNLEITSVVIFNFDRSYGENQSLSSDRSDILSPDRSYGEKQPLSSDRSYSEKPPPSSYLTKVMQSSFKNEDYFFLSCCLINRYLKTMTDQEFFEFHVFDKNVLVKFIGLLRVFIINKGSHIFVFLD